MTSTIKVNTIQNTCGADIIKESSNTITIGASGDTVTLASGASQTGFGRTGTVDWQTTKKTASFTAANGEGYFIDTSDGAVTMTLPASPSAGDIVAFKDYSRDFSTNNLTIGRNGSNLDGNASNKAIDTNNTSMSLVYVDATQGWKSVEEGTGYIGEVFITATGGTITTSGNCKIHTFTGPGTFCVSEISSTPANNTVSYTVVAGGASGAVFYGGGGGAGGFREYKSPVTPYTASPLDGNPGGTAITVTATSFPITVGGGGSVNPSSCKGDPGSNSVFSTITSAAGGGGGRGGCNSNFGGLNGGSGGGGGSPGPGCSGSNSCGGSGNTPPVTPAQGKDGGNGNRNPSTHTHGGGGGGATVVGTNAGGENVVSGCGGDGATTSISATPTAYAGGGGGAVNTGAGGLRPNGGSGGGGRGGGPGGDATSGTANTGGGGGAGKSSVPGTGAGGSGIVIIRYKFQ
jgi:hypothetical protein